MVGALVVAAFSVAGCKKQKPPAMTRVWLGPTHGCGIVENGGLYCWGKNERGQLGDGSTESRLLPVKASGFVGANKVLALAEGATCRLSETGEARCSNDVSPIASDPSFTGIVTRGAKVCTFGPGGLGCSDGDPKTRRELVNAPIVSAAINDSETCAAVREPVEVRCIGRTDRRILGSVSVTSIAGGANHSCALLADGTVRCWGANRNGQLGDGSTADAADPVVVNGVDGAIEIGAGNAHTCALLRSHTVACWGSNAHHQLANGTTQDSARAFPIFGIVGAIELAVAGDSACVRLSDGSVRCWGRNDVGQLGDGTTIEHDVPMPIKVARP